MASFATHRRKVHDPDLPPYRRHSACPPGLAVTPGPLAGAIRRALHQGWQPESRSEPFHVTLDT